MERWRKNISRRNGERRVFRIPRTGTRLGVRWQLQMAPAATVSRFCQLLNGHDMKAAFLCEKWGWTDLDECWWCKSRRQSRENLHLEKGIRALWKETGEAAGSKNTDKREDAGRASRGFRYHVRQATAALSNTAVRDLLLDERSPQ